MTPPPSPVAGSPSVPCSPVALAGLAACGSDSDGDESSSDTTAATGPPTPPGAGRRWRQ